MPSSDARERYLAEARNALRSATLDELLSFISVRQIVGGTATAAFYQAFPGGREELISELKREAAPSKTGSSTPITVGTISRAMQLVGALKDGDPTALEELREVALANFDQILGSGEGDSGNVLRALMAAVAVTDDQSREQLREFYDALAREYAGLFEAILTALNRKPIEEIGSVVDLTMAFSAMVSGLSLRSRLGQPGKAVLAGALLPILEALTVSVDGQQADPARSLLP